MQKELNYRLEKLEEEIQNIIKSKLKQRDAQSVSHSSCPASCDNIPKYNAPTLSKSFINRSLSAPSKINSSRKRKNDGSHRRKDKKTKNINKVHCKTRSPERITNTILRYIENLEKSLRKQKQEEEESVKTTSSFYSKTDSNASYEQSLICNNVLTTSHFENKAKDKKEKSTNQIKKELIKLRQQLDNLENTKKDAIELTKTVILKDDKKDTKTTTEENKSQSTSTDSQTIKRCDTSQSDLILKIAKKDETIKTLKESYKSLYQNLKQQEEKNAHLTKSLQSSQAQLRENRKSFQKYENLMQENMTLSMKIGEFQQSLERKDETNKKLMRTAEALAKDMHERDNINTQLNDNILKLQETIMELGDANKKMRDENNLLTKAVKDKEQKYIEIKKKYDTVEKKIDTFKYQMEKSQMEIGRLRQMVSNHGKQELSKEKDMERIIDQLKEYKVRENEFITEITYLMKQVRTLKAEKAKQDEEYEYEVRKLKNVKKKSQSTITDLKGIEGGDQQSENACEEIIKLRQTMSDNEKHLHREKEELKSLVQELTNILKTQKDRIGELSDFNRQQEQILDIQKQTLSSKEREIEETRKEAQDVANRCLKLEEEVNELRTELQILNDSKKVDESNATLVDNSISILVNQLENSLSMLNEEKETVKIKNKIIESQNATISELKLQINEKNEEIKRADVELKRLLRDFNASNEESERIRIELCEEKKAKELMYEDIERLKRCKEDLLGKFADLEREFSVYNRRKNVGDAENHKEVIETLHKKLKTQEMEWIKNSQLLLQEKEKAIEAAKFATQKLVDTVNDFQKQVDAHQHIQKMLTNLLHEKDEKIRTTLAQMNTMTTELSKAQYSTLGIKESSQEFIPIPCENFDTKKDFNKNLKPDSWKEDSTVRYLMPKAKDIASNSCEMCCNPEWISFESKDSFSRSTDIIKKLLLATDGTSGSQFNINRTETIQSLSSWNAFNKSADDFPHSVSGSHIKNGIYTNEIKNIHAYTGSNEKRNKNPVALNRNMQETFPFATVINNNYPHYEGVQEVKELFIRRHVAPQNLHPVEHQNQCLQITVPKSKPVRYFSLLKKS